MNRVSLKIVGSSGQGINSVGEIVAKALKRGGYCVFGYREYPSLIKGGHASYQLDISNEEIRSSETKVNIVISFNHHGFEHNIPELKPNGVFIHSTPNWKFTDADNELIKANNLHFIYLPIEEILTRLSAKAILANVILTACVWSMLGQEMEPLKKMVGEKFAKKKDLLEMNMKCIEEGFAFREREAKDCALSLPKPGKKWQDHLLITGSEAMGLGAVHAGVRLYAGYPMTPSSPLLSYIAAIQNKTGMVIKQAEDEITAAQMVSGAMHMGTRALTATSGGGFDLMSETLSLNAIIENPTVFVLAQRPGPATGLPTWTGQGDLLMAIHTAHGEFARCIIGVSDAEDSFDLMNDAFNLAEQFQISVIVLTDKQIAEALFTQEPFDQKKAKINRGHLVTDEKELAALKSADRFDVNAKDGISPRWLPGSAAATYNAQGDEHSGDGSIDESAPNAIAQLDKRMKKLAALKEELPEPVLYGAKKPDILLIGWGSTKGPVLDALENEAFAKLKIGYLHFTYLWPLKTELLEKLMKQAKTSVLIEGNYQGQLGMLIRQETGLQVTHKILKYDGRPFFTDELIEKLQSIIA
ncbi:MAG: 2-oxoacid:acceptor oxidoreductase subunit alpha [Candidatus Peribacteraceae bacterium]|nr:2-oxoacid:acceptor oxidoreductase subunit alpha [Candidatus Peribacteraceae bacterium]